MTDVRWTHRIDAVPEVGRRIAFVSDSGKALGANGREGRVVRCPPGDNFWKGIGDDVRILPDRGILLLIPSLTYAWWRYLDDGDELNCEIVSLDPEDDPDGRGEFFA